MRGHRSIQISSLVSIICLFSLDALAGGYASARFGGEHGHPATDHPTAIYYNPAGLALGTGTRIYIEGLFVYRSASYDRSQDAIDNLGTGTPDNADAIAANSGQAELSNFLASPFLGVASDLGVKNLAVAAGLYAPFGGQALWKSNDQFADNQQYPGAYDGPQRWSTISGSQRALYVTLAGAYRLPGRVSIGLGANLVQQSLSVLRARNLDGSDDLVDAVGELKEGRTLLDGENTSLSIGAGLLWEANDALRIGLSYQSTPGFGTSALEGTLTSKLGANPESVTDTTTLLTLPDIIRLGLSYRISPRLEVRLSGDYTRWSVFESHCVMVQNDESPHCRAVVEGDTASLDASGNVLAYIPRNWQDTWGVRGGGSLWVSDAFEVFAGTGFDSSAVPDETLDAGLMDMNKVVSSAGIRYGMLDGAMLLTCGLTNVFYFSRTVEPRTGGDPLIEQVQQARSPDGAGEYKQSINLLTVGVQYGF